MNSNKIPKTIWFLWFQGYEQAPYLVKKCWQSWIKYNPEWNIVFLDEQNLPHYVELDLTEPKIMRLGKPQIADLVRLELLAKYGGCWVDSTCFCNQPLDEWLDESASSGFFAFSNPGRDRLISNWFLAAEQNSVIATKLFEDLINYFTTNDYRNVNKTTTMRYLKKILCRTTKTTKIWFTPLFTKLLKLYPYYCFHYLFTELVNNDEECRNIWQNMPKLSASSCHVILKNMYSPLTEEIKQSIDDCSIPVYKLSYKKYDAAKVNDHNAIQYLLRSV